MCPEPAELSFDPEPSEVATGLVASLTPSSAPDSSDVSWTLIAEFRPAFLPTTFAPQFAIALPLLTATGPRHPGSRPKVAASAPQSSTVGLARCKSPAGCVRSPAPSRPGETEATPRERPRRFSPVNHPPQRRLLQSAAAPRAGPRPSRVPRPASLRPFSLCSAPSRSVPWRASR